MAYQATVEDAPDSPTPNDDNSNTTPPLPPNNPASADSAKSETVSVKVKDDRTEMFFKLKRTAKLGKLMQVFCDRQSTDRATARFLLDGRKVLDEDTPDTLEMEDGDQLEMHLHQIGGH